MSVKIENIFCPVDVNSETAEVLYLPFALARDFGAKLTLCGGSESSSPAEKSNDERRKLKALVKEVREKFPFEAGEISREPKLLIVEAADNIAEKIVCRAIEQKADLIVMHRNGNPLNKSLTLGTIAERIIRTAPCPVLIAGQNTAQFDGDLSACRFRRILAAHDFSDYSEIALQYACCFAEKFDSQLDLLHVLAEPIRDTVELAWTDVAVERLYHQTVNRLKTTARTCELRAKKTATCARWGSVYQEILKYAEDNDIDLIAMGKHGANFGEKSLFGSNVERVLRQTSCAILIASPIKRECPLWAREFSQSNE